MNPCSFLPILLAVALHSHGRAALAEEEGTASPEPDLVIERLREGNRRYVEMKLAHPDLSAERRTEVARGQRPIAAILSCSDSRVPPEIVFDQGLGDLFVVRVAGNVTDDAVLGSLEYATHHLGVRLVLVLGHERCGAVEAALRSLGEHALPGHLEALVGPIRPAASEAMDSSSDSLDVAVRANVRNVVRSLRESQPVLSEGVREGTLRVSGARYDLDTGEVEFVE